MSRTNPIGVAEIEAAQGTIAGTVHRTRMERSTDLSNRLGVPVHLKLEHHQRTGSFKLRGATNAVLSLSDEERKRGVVGVSTGNHGRGLAYAARQNGVRCIVAMSELVPQNKIDGIRAQGAEVRIIGCSQDDAQIEVDRLVAEEGMTMIPPFDHPGIIAGQGTLGLELAEDLPDLTTVLVQLSGGGLISGVAAALKARLPEVRVIGVSMERGAAMFECQRVGKPMIVPELTTLADSLGGGIGLDNEYTFAITRDLVDDIILVSEAEIAQAIRHAYWQEHQIIEGSGAVGIAALLSGKVKPDGPTAVILSGGNIDMNLHHRIISGEDVDVTQTTEEG
ncbi:hydroxyectoine utilization dehydratase EutB [uncultured Roseovarius sp.]|uniref:hydroxyectoine utilization dehydratase EutB n=1 Tax=uncultured Roseovarius sp. TaxID=293344 RepID=UPI0026098637|nr:hydroxyectoine utilization dehydratase EutB [uncultured Roseovarius sp.]